MTLWCARVLLALCLIFTVNFAACSSPGSLSPTTTVKQFITAAQSKDIKSIVPLMASYQAHIATLKANNPQTLWGKLIDDYNAQCIQSLETTPNVFMALAESTRWGDPTAAIRAVIPMLPTSAKWKISETRSQQGTDFLSGRPIQTTTVYVNISYPLLDNAPESGGKFLKETILNFSADTNSGLLQGIASVPNGNVYWVKPYPGEAQPFLAKKFGMVFRSTQQEQSAHAALNELTEVSWDLAEPQLIDAVEKQTPFYRFAVPVLAEHKSVKALPQFVNIVRQQPKTRPQISLCNDSLRAVVSGISWYGNTKQEDAVAVLRESLSAIFTATLGQQQKWVNNAPVQGCLVVYFTALSQVDGQEWSTFRYWYAGQIEEPIATSMGDFSFWKLVADFSNQKNAVGTVDATSPNASKILQTLKGIELCVPKPSWQCPTRFFIEGVTVKSASSAELSGYFDHWDHRFGGNYDRVASYRMEIGSSKSAASGWLVKDFVEQP
jgi:hypothetical protein